MAKKTKPKAKVNDVLMHNEERKMFIVTDVSKYPKGNLYTMKEITTGDNVAYKRCYENNLSDKYIKTKNSKAAKVLYGKK